MRFLDFQQVDQAQQKLIDNLQEELETSSRMQTALMPSESPQMDGFDIAGTGLSANHVGGDFFQYFKLCGDRLAFSMADVTGKAMAVAIPVVMFSGILRTEMRQNKVLEQLYYDLNKTLCEVLQDRTHVCFLMGDLDPSTRSLRMSNSGCPYPLHYQAASKSVVELQADAYPLGVRPATRYRTIGTDLAVGDYLVLCSDGIMEAMDDDGSALGFDRMR